MPLKNLEVNFFSLGKITCNLQVCKPDKNRIIQKTSHKTLISAKLNSLHYTFQYVQCLYLDAEVTCDNAHEGLSNKSYSIQWSVL